MSILNSLSLAIDLATRKKDQAVMVLQHLQRMHEANQNQMGQLESYAAETEHKWAVTAQAGSTPELMGHHYQFMARLHHAISLQQDVLGGSAQKVEAARRLTMDGELRLASLRLVLKKKKADLGQLQGRREQKQMDEFAAVQSRRMLNLN
ncbi:flagellar export protein FliJ [Rhodoferax sp. PAMC 29310]|uniref:flagellar export protein FliJ n=1 Tax=Rhodoferax sp. PAMC 29310 TaxID=2822760 RepID=UPI001B31A3C2|nr:flagellar export protein FliJ [Rhodoferax sp. PAMC 29310]